MKKKFAIFGPPIRFGEMGDMKRTPFWEYAHAETAMEAVAASNRIIPGCFTWMEATPEDAGSEEDGTLHAEEYPADVYIYLE